MKRLLAALLLAAWPAVAQVKITTAPCKLTDGSCGAASYATMPAPTGCASGFVPYFNASLRLVCSPTVYAPATDTTTSTGTIAARNLTATALATPVITPPVSPVLSLLTTVTVVAGASLVDGDYFTLSDGSAVVYEFDNDATVTPGRVGITFVGDETAQAIRDLVVVAINGSTLAATAIAAAADTLTVTSDLAGDTMGVNSENVTAAGFLVPAWSEPVHATTYGYKVVAYLPDGTSTAASAEVTTAAGHATLSASNYNTVLWGAVTGAATYKLYRTTGGAAPPKLIYSGALLTFTDIGAAGTAETPATVNTTGVLTGRGVLGNGTTVAAGGSASTARLGGVLHVDVTTQATTGTAEETLATYTLPANTLSANGKAIRITLSGLHAANTNSATMGIKFAGSSIGSATTAVNAGFWMFQVLVVRASATTLKFIRLSATGTSTAVVAASQLPTLAFDPTIANDITVTATTATAAGDATFNAWVIEALN